MDASKQRAIQFLEKEIKTYRALALFLSKERFKKQLPAADKDRLIRPAFYEGRMREASKLVNELSRSN